MQITPRNIKHMLIPALLLWVGCGGYEHLVPDSKSSAAIKDPEIIAAREWYELNKYQVLEQPEGQHPLFATMEPNWVETYTRENDKYKTVESALITRSCRRRILPECHEKYEQTKDRRYLQSKLRLVIRTDLKSGGTVGFFMTITPSAKYLEATKFKPFYGMTYIDRNEDFDGEIVYYELNGQFANGWIYKDGNITGSLRRVPPDLPADSLTRCVNVYEDACTDLQTTTKFEDSLQDDTTSSR